MLVLLLVDLMISLALPCGKQVEDVNKLLLEELHDSEVNCGDRASKVAMLTTEWLFKQVRGSAGAEYTRTPFFFLSFLPYNAIPLHLDLCMDACNEFAASLSTFSRVNM